MSHARPVPFEWALGTTSSTLRPRRRVKLSQPATMRSSSRSRPARLRRVAVVDGEARALLLDQDAGQRLGNGVHGPCSIGAAPARQHRRVAPPGMLRASAPCTPERDQLQRREEPVGIGDRADR